MKLEDALRKIRLLRQVKAEHGASDAEAENASAIIRTLMERFAVKSEEVRPSNEMPFRRMTWVYWDHLLEEHGLELRHFGKRGSVSIGSGEKSSRSDDALAQQLLVTRGIDPKLVQHHRRVLA